MPKASGWRKFISSWSAAFLTGGVVILLVVIVAGWLLMGDLCKNELVLERPSPSGKYRAIVFERDCGATTHEVTHISVVRGNKKLNNGMTANCASIDRTANQLGFEWKSDEELVIDVSGNKVSWRNDNCDGVHVSYR